MATPKIKIYRLEQRYSQDTDNDIQGIINDELLPIVDKSLIPNEARFLYGVIGFNENLKPIGDPIIEMLSNPGEKIQTSTNGNWITDGAFAPVLLDDTMTIIPKSEYTINAELGQIIFNDIPYPVNVTITYYVIPDAKTYSWYCQNYPLYNRVNYNFFERVHCKLNNQTFYIDRNDYIINYDTGMITFSQLYDSVSMKYYMLNPIAKLFVSDHTNWVYGHIRTNPDIFKGMKDYPADSALDNYGNSVNQGAIPMFVDSGFQINYRDGTVEFSEYVNSQETPVRSNYAYYIGIKNVTGQVLDYDTYTVNGYKYKAISEKYYPDSHGKRWVTRNNNFMPQNFYNDDEVIPKQLTTIPFAVLENKVTTSLLNDSICVVSDYKIKSFFQYVGQTGTNGKIKIDNETIDFGKRNNNAVIDNIEYSIGDIINKEIQKYYFKIKIYSDFIIALYDFIFKG